MKTRLLAIFSSLAMLGMGFPAMAGEVSPTDYFSEATTSLSCCGSSSTSTGQVGTTTAQSTNPATEIYYSGGTYNTSGGTPVSEGGATALADRGTGQLHAGAGATSFNDDYSVGFPASATASFGDTLFFTDPGASATQLTTVGFEVQIDGTLGASGQLSGQPGGSLYLAIGNISPQGGFNPTTSGVHQSYADSLTWSGQNGLASTIDQVLTGTFTFEGPDASIAIYMSLNAGGQYGYANFDDTATFSFDTLPTGVSFTSASGEFLTPTPLPSTWTMLIAGFVCLGFFAYRGSKKNDAPLAAT